MKKTNKLLLSIGVLGAIATPVSAVISCGHHTTEKNQVSKDATDAELRHIETPEESLFWSSWLTGAGTTLIKAKGFSEYASIPAGYQIPSTVQVIDGAFEGITLPKDFFIPSNVRVIKSNSFARAKLPEGFTLPASIELIKKGAFYDATLPVGFAIGYQTNVEEAAFTNVNIPSSSSWIDKKENVQSDSNIVKSGWGIASSQKLLQIRNKIFSRQNNVEPFRKGYWISPDGNWYRTPHPGFKYHTVVDQSIFFTNPIADNGSDSTYQKDEYIGVPTSDSYIKMDGKDYAVFKINGKVSGITGSAVSGLALISTTNANNGTIKIRLPYIPDFFGDASFVASKDGLYKSDVQWSDVDLQGKLTDVNIGMGFMGPIIVNFTDAADQIKANIAKALVQGFTKVQAPYQKYSFGIDHTKSSATYNDIDAVKKYEYHFAIPASVTTPNWETQSLFLYANNKNEEKLSEWQHELIMNILNVHND